ncbi:hypothetical protein DRJ16_00130 [Candidatus Woesearchaeota archaeon]|nr:MAG: hypothetical protein DRJ16_00130 [Candidatus Woesearchaeota archaeon]
MKEVKIKNLKECYDLIVELIKEYIDIDEKYVPILALWVIGTYFHDEFRTFPYLYINATKGGGKTRLLGLLSFLSKNGRLNVDLTESVLFREANKKIAFFIDELENITRKEKTALRLLLNSAYKKGVYVTRSKKLPRSEKFITEKFHLYTPIAMANIWGLDNVLQDRCITVILEKSCRPEIVKKIELWDLDPRAKAVKEFLAEFSDVSDVTLHQVKYIINVFPLYWNALLNNVIYTYTEQNVTYDSINTEEIYNEMVRQTDWLDLDNPELCDEFYKLGKKIWLSGLSGRDLELFLPLILIAWEVGEPVLDNLLKSIESLEKEKKTEEITENRDNLLIAFLYNWSGRTDDWIKIKDIARDFKEQEEEEWINSRWVGRALKRLGIRKFKRKLAHGREVKIDWKKVDQKARMLGVEKLEEEEKEEVQTSLKERPDWEDRLEEKKKFMEQEYI